LVLRRSRFAGRITTPPPGREHDTGQSRELRQHRLLAIAKRRFALDLEYRGNGHAELALELGVGVDEGLVEAPRELPAKRRFAGAGQADEIEIAAMQLHPGIVVDAPMRLPKSVDESSAGRDRSRAPAYARLLDRVDRFLDDARREEDEKLLLLGGAPVDLKR
jgi:hypothetical protein